MAGEAHKNLISPHHRHHHGNLSLLANRAFLDDRFDPGSHHIQSHQQRPGTLGKQLFVFTFITTFLWSHCSAQCSPILYLEFLRDDERKDFVILLYSILYFLTVGITGK